MKIELHPLNQGQDWDNITSSFKHTFFETSIWAKIVQQGYSCDVFLILLKNNSRILLGLPAMILNFKIMKLLFAYYPYGNFFGDKSYIPSFFQELNKFLSDKSHAHKVRFTKTHDDFIITPSGYRQSMSWQHILDLESKTEESLWSGYKKRIRRDIRKAQRSGVIISEVKNEKEIDDYYRLYIKTMIRNCAFRPHTKEFYKAIYQYLVKENKASFLLAKVDAKIIGGLITLFSNDIAYYLGNASDVGYLKFCPNDLLLHSAIVSVIKRNLKYFDFMTISYDDVSLMKFKEKWGAKRLPFYTYEKDFSLLRTTIWDFLRKINQNRIGTYIFNKVQILIR